MCPVESAACPLVDNDKSWEISIRNFKADISFKEPVQGKLLLTTL